MALSLASSLASDQSWFVASSWYLRFRRSSCSVIELDGMANLSASRSVIVMPLIRLWALGSRLFRLSALGSRL